MAKPRILVIDDEAAIRDSLRMTLEYEGYEFIGAATGQEGLALAERDAPDLVLTDLKMPGLDGLAILRKVRAEQPEVEVIMMTGFATVETAVEAVKAGAYDYLTKPFENIDEVALTVAKAAERKALREQAPRLDGLGDVLDRAALERGHRRAHRAVAGDQHRLGLGAGFVEHLDERDAVPSG